VTRSRYLWLVAPAASVVPLALGVAADDMTRGVSAPLGMGISLGVVAWLDRRTRLGARIGLIAIAAVAAFFVWLLPMLFVLGLGVWGLSRARTPIRHSRRT
jgi:dolichyl-phosphate-mannose--protein O-mannosyl transferase